MCRISIEDIVSETAQNNLSHSDPISPTNPSAPNTLRARQWGRVIGTLVVMGVVYGAESLMGVRVDDPETDSYETHKTLTPWSNLPPGQIIGVIVLCALSVVLGVGIGDTVAVRISASRSDEAQPEESNPVERMEESVIEIAQFNVDARSREEAV